MLSVQQYYYYYSSNIHIIPGLKFTVYLFTCCRLNINTM